MKLSLYNQVDYKTRLEALNLKYPLGTTIGIKHPYLKIEFIGHLSIRNDNPQNIIIHRKDIAFRNIESAIDQLQSLIDRGLELFDLNNHFKALKIFQQVLKVIKKVESEISSKYKVQLYIIKCFYEMSLFEDGLEMTEQLLLEFQDNNYLLL
jgi:tetratricopeptide (TPR) repeat protein